MDTLMLCPLQASFNVDYGTGVVVQKLDGGAGCYRRRIIGASHTASVSWSLKPDQYQYLLAFYRVQMRKASQPFLYRLIVDNAPAEEYEVFFVPGSVRLTAKNGRIFSVSAQLEVKAKPADDEFDQQLVDFWSWGGDGDYINILDHLANVKLPDTSPRD